MPLRRQNFFSLWIVLWVCSNQNRIVQKGKQSIKNYWKEKNISMSLHKLVKIQQFWSLQPEIYSSTKKRYREADITNNSNETASIQEIKQRRETKPIHIGKEIPQRVCDKDLCQHGYFEKSIIIQMIEGVLTKFLKSKNI